jgi:hypothetical protein
VNAAALPRLSLYPMNFIRLGKFGLGLVGVPCAVLLFAALFARKPGTAFILDAMLVLVCTLQVLAVGLQGQALGRSVSVLQLQRAPALLWRVWLRQWLVSVTRYWAILGLTAMLPFLVAGSHTHWLAVPASLSLMLCAGALAVLARAGLLPRHLGTALETTVLALLAYLVAASKFSATLHAFTALPMPLLALCALAWPAMAYRILTTQGDALRSVTGRQTDMLRRLRDAIARWFGRFQPLREQGTNAAYPVDRRTMMALAVMQNFILFTQLLSVEWGEDVPTNHMTRLALVCIMCSGALLVRDLHWRSLLLPGGTQLRHLGARIVLSTLAFQVPLALIVSLGGMVLSPPQEFGPNLLASVAVPVLELACCTSLMTMLRALPRRAQTCASLCLLIPMAYAYIPAWLKLDVPQLTWRIGPAYALLLAAVTAVAVTVANRCWTPQRLLNALTVR